MRRDVVDSDLYRRRRTARQHHARSEERERGLANVQMPQHFAILTTSTAAHKAIVVHPDRDMRVDELRLGENCRSMKQRG
jgi:hypothetical protein